MSMSIESTLTCDRLWQNARLATMTGAGMVEDGGEPVAPVDGQDVRLTIDSKIQFFAYQKRPVFVIINKKTLRGTSSYKYNLRPF